MRSKGDIRDIYARKAECKADETTVKNFIPPQYYDRFMALNRLCSGRRQEGPQLKTQVCFGDKDLEILTKIKGSDDPYRVVDLRQFAAGGRIPDFNPNLRWKWQEDRQPRRRVMSNTESPSKEKDNGRRPARRDQLTSQPMDSRSSPPSSNDLINLHSVQTDQPASKQTSSLKPAGQNLTRLNSGSENTDAPKKKIRRKQVEEEDVEMNAGDITL